MIHIAGNPPPSPDLPDRILVVTFPSASEPAHGKFEVELRKLFHNGSDVQWGSVRVEGLSVALGASFPPRAEGYYHSKHGLFLEVGGEYFLPEAWADGGDLCVHCWYVHGAWHWRLVRSLPTEPNKNVVRDLLERAWRGLEDALLSKPLRASRLDRVELTTVPEWADPVATVPSGPARLDFGVTGFWLELLVAGAPLRLQPSRITTLQQGVDWLLVFREGVEAEPAARGGVRYVLALDPKDLRVAALRTNAAGPDATDTPSWRVACRAVQPRRRGSDPSAPVPQPPDAEAAHGLWLKHEDEWLQLPVTAWAKNEAQGESRRWSCPDLPALAQGLRCELWLDNCGRKELRIGIDANGALLSVELHLEKLLLTAEIGSGVVPGSWLSTPDLPPGPVPEHSWSEPGALVLLGTSASAVDSTPAADCILELDRQRARLRFARVTHWQRPPSCLVGPVAWAANDRSAAIDLSTLRGLVPLQYAKCAVEFGSPRVQLAPEDVPCFPAFAIGAHLLLARPGYAIGSAEVEIVAATEVVVRHRYANPHLDAQFAMPAAALARDGHGVVDARWTWVTDRHRGVAKRRSSHDVLADNCSALLPDQVVPGDFASVASKALPLEQFASALFTGVYRETPRRIDAWPKVVLTKVIGQELEARPLRVHRIAGELAIDFTIVEPLRSAGGQPARVLTASRSGLSGAIALSAEWLARNCEGKSELRWQAGSGGLEVKFLRVVSEQVQFRADDPGARLELAALEYWFRLDGLEVKIASDDCIVLADGKWRLDRGGALLMNGEKPEFRKRHPVALLVEVEEVLLGPSAPALVVHFGGRETSFEIRTGYLAAESGAAAADVTLLQAGSYHLAWAGSLTADPTQGPASLGNFQLDALTRLFLRLDRNFVTGGLRAQGMVGWRCPKVVLGPHSYESQCGRATLYSGQRGDWSLLRVSGKWAVQERELRSEADDPSPDLSRPSALVFYRHEFSLTTVGDRAVAESITPWMITEWSGIPAYQQCAVRDGVIVLRGLVGLLSDSPVQSEEDREKANKEEVEKLRTAVELETLPLHLARWGVNSDVTLGGEPISLHTLAPDAEELGIVRPVDGSGGALALEVSDHDVVLLSPVNVAWAATRLSDRTWLLCPVRKTLDLAGENRGPKLRVLADGDEDLIQLDGFLEKVEGGGPRKTDPAGLRRCAEQVLTFLRWRKPAVLEFWQGQTNGKVVWTVVDAPLLNIFSGLDFLRGVAPARTASWQPDMGRVAAAPADRRLLATTGNAGEMRFEARGGRDLEGHPFVHARVQRKGVVGPGVLRVSVETPFEHSADDLWSHDGSPWLSPRESSPVAEGTFALLPPLDLRFSCPRPGELLEARVEAITVSAADPAAGPTEVGSAMATATVRTPRAQVVESIEFESRDGTERGRKELRWRMRATVPVPMAENCLRVLAGLPNVRRLVSGAAWPLAIAWRAPAGPAGMCPYVVVVHLESKQPFEVSVDGQVHTVSKDTTVRQVCIVVGEGLMGRRLRVVVVPGPAQEQQPAADVDVKVHVKIRPDSAALFFEGDPEQFMPVAEGGVVEQIPNRSFQVIPEAAARDLLPPAPHLVALLREGRLLAYGPSLLGVDVVFDAATGSCDWLCSGSWQSPATGWQEPPDTMVAIRPDGSVNLWPAPKLSEPTTPAPAAPADPTPGESVTKTKTKTKAKQPKPKPDSVDPGSGPG